MIGNAVPCLNLKGEFALPNVKLFVDSLEKTVCDCESIQTIRNNSGRGKAPWTSKIDDNQYSPISKMIFEIDFFERNQKLTFWFFAIKTIDF